MDLSKLTTADKVIVGSAIAFLIFMFLPWWGIEDEFSDASFTQSGWDYFLTGWIPLLFAILMVTHLGVTRFSPDTKLPDPPLPWGQAHMILGIAAAVLLLLRTLIGSSVGAFGFDVDLEREFGLYLALLAAIGLAAGGFLKSKEVEEGSAAGGAGPTTPF